MKRRAVAPPADDGEQAKPKTRRYSSTQKEAGRRTEEAGRKSASHEDGETWAVGDWITPPFMTKQLQGLQEVRSRELPELRDSRRCC